MLTTKLRKLEKLRLAMNNLITVQNYSEKINEHSIMMMCCMAMCRLTGVGGPPM